MSEFIKNEVQLVAPSQPVALDSSLWFRRNYIFHQSGSGIITLRGIVNNPYANYTAYQVTFNGNIALPEGATVGPIAIAIARNGEIINTSRAIVTPAAVDEYFNVTSTAFIVVPRGCNFDISIENASEASSPTTPAPSINVQNANLVIERIA